MNALSIYLPRWFSWNNLRFQWGVIGLILLGIGYVGFLTLPVSGIIIAAFLSIAAFAFLHDAIKMPLPQNQNMFVQWYESRKRWWSTMITPGYYGVPHTQQGLHIIRPVLIDFFEVYDLQGNLLGHEQDIFNDGNWSFSLLKGKVRHMPLIAFRRTRYRRPSGVK